MPLAAVVHRLVSDLRPSRLESVLGVVRSQRGKHDEVTCSLFRWPVLKIMLVENKSTTTVDGSPGGDDERMIPSVTFIRPGLNGRNQHRRIAERGHWVARIVDVASRRFDLTVVLDEVTTGAEVETSVDRPSDPSRHSCALSAVRLLGAAGHLF